jgi:NADPH-dependent ferric siderophore reductase
MPILEPMLLSDVLPASIAWQPGEGDLVLLAADAADLLVVETVLATLPAKARGQVFIEVDAADQVRPLAAPGRVCVSWLRRDRGQSLTVAVDAWLAEMLPVEFDREHRVYAWRSGDHAARVLTSEQPV